MSVKIIVITITISDCSVCVKSIVLSSLVSIQKLCERVAKEFYLLNLLQILLNYVIIFRDL